MNFASIVVVLLVAPVQDHAGKVAWQRDLDAALSEAGSRNTCAMVYFSADW